MKIPSMPCFRALLGLSLLVLCLGAGSASAQNYEFARLSGAPLNTSGWQLAGDAYVGAAPGSPANTELILTDPVNNTSGAAFFNTPVNITFCQKWVADFEYRIFDGTGADGIAFCFLVDPPRDYIRGGGVGIPSRPTGLAVVMDPWNNGNCGGQANPELQIRYLDGTSNYSECPTGAAQPTLGPLPEIRQANYNRMRITYDNGNIAVFINNTLRLTGFYNITFAGYFGFTASTGGSTDRHSIRNFTMRTFKPILSAPNAGPDRSVCSDRPTRIGVTPVPGDPYTYSWFPTTGLDNPNVSDPVLTYRNTSNLPVVLSYFVTKDTLGVDSVCAFSDEVRITVLGRGAFAGTDFSVCSGEARTINVASQAGYNYVWTPATGLDNPNRSNPTLRLVNNTNAPQTFTYFLTAINTSQGCSDMDTLMVTVLPRVANAGPDAVLCSDQPTTLGTPGRFGFFYSWSPTTGLNNPSLAQPTLRLTNAGTTDLVRDYILTVSDLVNGCITRDTVRIRVKPQVGVDAGPASVTVCPGDSVRLGPDPAVALPYRWRPHPWLSDTATPNPWVRVPRTATPRSLFFRASLTQNGCTGFDSIEVRVAPLPVAPAADTFLICHGQPTSLPVSVLQGQSYRWVNNLAGLANPNDVNTQVLRQNTTGVVQYDTYFLRIETSQGCADTIPYPAKISPEPISGLVSPLITCSGVPGTVTMSQPAGYRYFWAQISGPPVQILNAIASNTGLLAFNNGSRPDTAYLQVSIQNVEGCTRTDTLAFIITPRSKADGGPDLFLCYNQADTLGPQVVPTGYIWSWSPARWLDDSTLARPIVRITHSDDTVGVYPFILTRTEQATGCQALDTVLVRVAPQLLPNAGPDLTVCSGEAFILGTLAPTHTVQYTWVEGPGLVSPNQPRSSATVVNTGTSALSVRYILRASVNGCQAFDTVMVTVRPLIPSALPDTVVVCSNQNTTINNTAEPGVSYRWLTTAGLDQTTIANPSIRLTRSSGGVQFLPYVLELRSGTCVQLDTTIVALYPLPTPLPDVSVCSGEALRLGLPAEPHWRYSWSPAAYLDDTTAAQPNFRAVNPDTLSTTLTYFRTVTDTVSGCSFQDDFQIQLGGRLQISAGADQTICAGDSVQVGMNPKPGYGYAWQGNFLSANAVANPWFKAPQTASGVQTLVLSATLAGCTVTDTVRITVLPQPSSDLADFLVFCSGDSGQIVHTPQSGYAYTWLTTQGLSRTDIANPKISRRYLPTDEGDSVFVYRVRITNTTTGCSRLDTIGVRVIGKPLANAGADRETCALQATRLGGDSLANYTYSWSPSTGLSNPNAAFPQLILDNTGSQPRLVSYVLTKTNTLTSCASTDTVQVRINPLPRFNLPREWEVCANVPTRLPFALDGTWAWRWTLSTGLSSDTVSNPIFTLPDVGNPYTLNYVVTATNRLTGCRFSDTLLVPVRLRPILGRADVSGRTSLCPSSQEVPYVVSRAVAIAGTVYNWAVLNGTITRRSSPFSDTVWVTWGAGGTPTRLSVWAVSPSGCNSDTVTLPIDLKRQPAVGRPTGDTALCDDANRVYTYSITGLPFAQYTWNIRGGTQVNGPGQAIAEVLWNNGPGIHQIWVEEFSTTATDTCLGSSDTLDVEVYPSPDPNARITGALTACASNAVQTYALSGDPNSTYAWQISPANAGTITAQSGNTVTISWSGATSAILRAQETTVNGCIGGFVQEVVDVLAAPLLQKVMADTLLCGNRSSLYRYEVRLLTPNPVEVRWQVVGGRIRSAGPDSLWVEVDWDLTQTTFTLQAYGVTQSGKCSGPTISFRLYKEALEAAVLSASLGENNESEIEVAYRLQNVGLPFQHALQRRPFLGSQADWQTISSSLPNGTAIYRDLGLPTSQQAWEYRLEARDACGNLVQSDVRNTILLKAEAQESEKTSVLSWNLYRSDTPAEVEYEIWQQLEGQGPFRLYERSREPGLRLANASEGFRHCYRIRAVVAGTPVSWSNSSCITFANPPELGNVITPNGDGKNDRFVVGNLNLYPNNELEVYDRWGTRIYRSSPYQNNWDGEGRETGVYFYTFRYNNQVVKGLINILR